MFPFAISLYNFLKNSFNVVYMLYHGRKEFACGPQASGVYFRQIPSCHGITDINRTKSQSSVRRHAVFFPLGQPIFLKTSGKNISIHIKLKSHPSVCLSTFHSGRPANS